MTYSLNSKRKIGNKEQQITTIYCDSNKTQQESLNFMKNIHIGINSLNYYNTSPITYTSFLQSPSEKHNNPGNSYVLSFTVESTVSDTPKFYQINLDKMNDYTIINDRITQAFEDVTGQSVTSENYYITNINIIFEG